MRINDGHFVFDTFQVNAYLPMTAAIAFTQFRIELIIYYRNVGCAMNALVLERLEYFPRKLSITDLTFLLLIVNRPTNPLNTANAVRCYYN